jgi:hypothetical protein
LHDNGDVIKENCPNLVLSWLLATNLDINAVDVLCNPIIEQDKVVCNDVNPYLSNECEHRREAITNIDKFILSNSKRSPFFVDFDDDPNTVSMKRIVKR